MFDAEYYERVNKRKKRLENLKSFVIVFLMVFIIILLMLIGGAIDCDYNTFI